MSSMNGGTMPTREAPPMHKPSIGRRFWAFPVTRIAVFLVLLAVLSLAIGLPLNFALRTAHVHLGQTSEAAMLIGEAVFAAASVGAFLLMVRLTDRRTAASAGLERRGLVSETALDLLIGGVLFSLVVGAMAAFGAYHVSGVNAHARLLIPLLLFLGVAVSEEIIFRGYVFQTLESRWGTGIALAASALLFGLTHLANPISGLMPAQKLVGPLFIVFEASIPMTAGYLLTRRMWLPIGIHWGWNFFESAVGSGAPVPGPHPFTVIPWRLSNERRKHSHP